MQNNYINLLIKPTNMCNLKCTYCFNDKSKSATKVLEINMLEKFLDIVFKESKQVQLVWHGGEPTLVGDNYYNDAFKMIKKLSKKYNNEVSQCIQTNAVVISEKLLKLFQENNVKIGTSYDGIHNEDTRGRSNEYLVTINHLQSININPGAICVVTSNNINDLLNTYKDFNRRGQSVNFRPIVVNDESISSLKVSVEEYSEKMMKLFDYWLKDKECKINVNPFNLFVKLLVGENSGVCNMGACIGNWLCIEPNGDITPCNRSFPFIFGNIQSVNSISDIYSSKGMNDLLFGAIQRREKCRTECDYFDYCKGGCNHEALVGGDISGNNFFECRVFKNIFGYVKKRFEQINSENNCLEYNPKINEFINVLLNNKEK